MGTCAFFLSLNHCMIFQKTEQFLLLHFFHASVLYIDCQSLYPPSSTHFTIEHRTTTFTASGRHSSPNRSWSKNNIKLNPVRGESEQKDKKQVKRFFLFPQINLHTEHCSKGCSSQLRAAAIVYLHQLSWRSSCSISLVQNWSVHINIILSSALCSD